jgi:cell division protein FtsI/penicillin-binding protein 2
MGFRFAALISGISLAYGFLLFNLYQLQLSSGGYYVARAGNQYASGMLSSTRGSIYFTDKNGNKVPMALNKDFPVIYAVPKAIEDPMETANRLAPILNIPVKDLEKRFGSGSSYDLLKKKADSGLAKEVEAMNIKGIYVDSQSSRYYPMGLTSSQLLGFVAPDSESDIEKGRYGIEEFYNERLAGQMGRVVDGKIMNGIPGEDLSLTIDPNIQIEAERILSSLVKKWGAKGGSVIVEEPQTGKILALSNYPLFDPNKYNQAELGDFLNPVTQKIYEPGSVFKVLTMAAGIDAGKISPETSFNDTGVLNVNGRKILNWDLKAHGKVDMTYVIEHSLNTGAAFAEKQTGDGVFRDYLVKFGISEKTGIDLPGELKGDLRSLFKSDAPAIAFASASFGQGVAATPLQVINSIAAIANGGKLMRPYLNAESEPKIIRKVITPEAASKVTGMMTSAVDEAKVAKINGYSIAGKTGTAQIADRVNGGYLPDQYINTYVGFGPTKDPKFAILIKIDQPKDAPLAGTTVVPAFRDLAQFILNYYNIVPDRMNETN